MKERIGVYICHCGGNISDYVDVVELGKMFQAEDGVVVSKDVMFACSDAGQKTMVSDIQEFNLDAIVVASCSPKLHLHTFKNVAIRAGLNPTNYVQVNIREQCSWPHSDQPREATVKAAGLIRAGINRVSHSVSLDNIEITVKKSAVVVGAGVSGMKAAIDLARMGNEVFLVEKDYFVGGRIAQNEKLFMSGQNGKKIVTQLFEELKSHKNITLFTGATIEKVSGSLGNFHVTVKIKPRFINTKADYELVQNAIKDCQVFINDDFNLGLSKRKAIYKNYPEALPNIPVANEEIVKENPEFFTKYASVIDFTQQDEEIALIAGSVLVTTGFDHYEPQEGEFGYKTNSNVLTLPEFKRLMELNPDKLMFNNKQIKNIAFIYCVGSRQTKGENKYCSRQCCTSTIYTSLELNEKYKNITAFHLYRDIRTYGKQELLYDASSKQGDIYLRYDEKEPPVVEQVGKSLLVKIKDHITAKKELELEADMVVLVTGMVARDDSKLISELFKIPIGSDKFFNEIHPKLKPVETVIKGVYIGGTCQGPKNISESVQSSLSAAAKINALLKGGTVSLDPIIARVNNDLCTWCGKCEAVCEYTAIREVEEGDKHIASVNTSICTGCGICAPVCPVNAIEIAQFTDIEIESMIDGFLVKNEFKSSEAPTEVVEGKDVQLMKKIPKVWKQILEKLSDGKKTVPEIAAAMGLKQETILYELMTMNKYSFVEPDGLDEDHAYYYYKIKNQ